MNKSRISFFIFLISLAYSQTVFSYVHSQTKSGKAIHWPPANPIIDIYVNSQNTQGLNEATVQSIASDSIQQWNGPAQITLRKNIEVTKDQIGFNELYFSTDPNVFNGTGVIGVTQVSFKEETGEIVEADVLINDTYFFTTNSTDQSFLGNVITHELGHFLGLGHGQVEGSTMFYALSRGQHQIADDDKAGLYSTYPSGSVSLGTLSGTIVGGKNLAVVFGTHVQAVSVKTGKVMGANLSGLDGKFTIDGLPLNDQYFIYTSPIVQLGLPSIYANVKNNFCDSSKPYRGSFFQSCGASSEGFPEAVTFNSASVNVGNVTIRCGLDVPPEYFQKKTNTPNDFDLNSYTTVGVGGTFTGFFSAAEIASSTNTPGSIADHFRLNLSQVNWNSISPTASLYVELKVMNQSFYSAFKANVNVKRKTSNYNVAPKYVQSADGRINIDTVTRFGINRADSSDNDFEIKIVPEGMEFPTFPTGIPFSKTDLFPSYSDLQDPLYFYLATATIVKNNGDGTFSQLSSKTDSLSDNTTCPDAVNTYSLTNYSATGTTAEGNRKKTAGCGTVDDTGNSKGGGPGGFMVGLILSFIIASALSRYSKMA